MAIESQGRQGSYNTVVFGDSIVEFAAIDGVCGGGILNAGVAGVRVEDLMQLAPAIGASVKPHMAIIAIGANDAARQFRTDAARFAASYRHLVESLQALDISLKLATIAPFGNHATSASGPYDPLHSSELNAQIRSVARDLALPVIDFAEMPKTASGALRADLTTDGVHLTSGGYQEWLSLLARAVCP
jgi:lysophospholipase L1-like esterase